MCVGDGEGVGGGGGTELMHAGMHDQSTATKNPFTYNGQMNSNVLFILSLKGLADNCMGATMSIT